MKPALVIAGGFGSPDIEWNYSPLMDKRSELDIYIFRKCSMGLTDITHNGLEMAQYVRHLVESRGYEDVYLMGHSMGGLIARVAEQFILGTAVKGLITVATPHYGTMLANLAKWLPSKSAQQMSIGSDFLKNINSHPARCRVYSIVCKYDQLVWPSANAIYRGSERVDIFNMEHVGPVFSRRVAKNVLQFICEQP